MLKTVRGCVLERLFILMTALLAWPAMGAETQAALLIYQVESPAEPTTINRLLATADFLRLDRGTQDSGYILFNRREGIIYSVNHEEASILVIDPPPLSETLQALAPEIQLKPEPVADAPTVGGVKPDQWSLSADGTLCRNAFVLPELMPVAVAAYAEYLRVLARQQGLALPSLPPEYQDACDSANHIFAADSLLGKGLPLNIWNEQGYRESLIDFRDDFQVPESDFTLPDGYNRSNMNTGV